jgi:hypothetical protein
MPTPNSNAIDQCARTLSTQTPSLKDVAFPLCASRAILGSSNYARSPPPPSPHRQQQRRCRSTAPHNDNDNGEPTLSVGDRLAILELCHRFDHAINGGHQAKLGAFFVDAGAVHMPKGSANGPAAIVALFQGFAPMAASNRHVTLSTVVEPAPLPAAERAAGATAAAVATSYRLLHSAAAPPALLASGVIHDELLRDAGGAWRFAKRTFAMDVPAAAAAAKKP